MIIRTEVNTLTCLLINQSHSLPIGESNRKSNLFIYPYIFNHLHTYPRQPQ